MRFHNLQLLRVAAALGVVAVHLAHYGATEFRAGELAAVLDRVRAGTAFAVPLFFALSGFVLTHALQTAAPGRFLFARFLRLYPGYWLALFVAAVVLCDGRLATGLPILARRLTPTEAFLWPGGSGTRMYLLGVEWSLFYEVFLSAALGVLGVLGPRRVGVAAGLWLAAIVFRVAVWPWADPDPVPGWRTVALSACNVPFLLGVLAYHARDQGRRWRWGVLAAVAGFAVLVPPHLTAGEWNFCAWGVVGAAAVWLAVQFRQVSPANPVARLGDFTYGLFLIHVPVIRATFRGLTAVGWLTGTTAGVFVAAAAALAAGFAFGWAESALHIRLRPLAKVRSGGWRPGRWVRLMRLTGKGRRTV